MAPPINPRAFGYRTTDAFRTILHYLPACAGCGSVATKYDRYIVVASVHFSPDHPRNYRCDPCAPVRHIDLPYASSVRSAFEIILEATQRPSMSSLPIAGDSKL